jgi:hypothetical protein
VPAGGYPPAAGEVGCTDHAAGVIVVPLVPPVVGELVAAVGISEDPQDVADGDGLVDLAYQATRCVVKAVGVSVFGGHCLSLKRS